MTYSVAVSVSFADDSKEAYDKSVHMVSVRELELSKEEAEHLHGLVVAAILSIRKERLAVFGVYKMEHPATDTKH